MFSFLSTFIAKVIFNTTMTLTIISYYSCLNLYQLWPEVSQQARRISTLLLHALWAMWLPSFLIWWKGNIHFLRAFFLPMLILQIQSRVKGYLTVYWNGLDQRFIIHLCQLYHQNICQYFSRDQNWLLSFCVISLQGNSNGTQDQTVIKKGNGMYLQMIRTILCGFKEWYTCYPLTTHQISTEPLSVHIICSLMMCS